MAAIVDLDGIRGYSLDQFGAEVAGRYLDSFEHIFKLLAEHPHIGVQHADFDPPIWSLPNGSHRVYYDVEGDLVIVQRVLHKASDAGARLRARTP